jgi:hypothetical protein
MSDESAQSEGAVKNFTAEDAMAFMQRMWNPFAVSMPGAVPVSAPQPAPAQPAPASATSGQASPSSAEAGAAAMASMMPMLPFPNPAAMFAALDPAEVERKIGELKVIEGWLMMTLNLMQMSIKTLELQRASLEALRAAHAPPLRRKGAGTAAS